MNEKPIQIVVAFDFTESSQHAIEHAVDLARRAVRRVFHFACIIDGRGGIPEVPTKGDATGYPYAELVQHAITKKIDAAFAACHVPEAVQFFVHARFGDPADELLTLARGVGASLIVVGGKTVTGSETVELGKVAERVMRRAGCSVVVARPRSYEEVALIPIEEKPATHTYHPPHRYSYEEKRVIQRPNDWPLY